MPRDRLRPLDSSEPKLERKHAFRAPYIPLRLGMGVSVVIPAYNAGAFIEDAITSVLRQETPADEIIVVNDGSTDRDYADLGRRHPTVRVVHQSNRGVSAARNVGCDAATGDNIAILDADDIWLPGKLREQMRHLHENPQIDAAFCLGREWTPISGKHEPLLPSPAHQMQSPPEVTRLYYSDFLCSDAVYPSTMVVKRSVWKSLGGFDERMRYGEDRNFYLRLSHRHQVVLLNCVAMLYRKHPASATAVLQQRNYLAEAITDAIRTLGLTDKFGNTVDQIRLKRHLSLVHFMHGYNHFWFGSFQVAQREFTQASRMNSSTLRILAYLALSCTPGVRNLLRRSRRPLYQP